MTDTYNIVSSVHMDVTSSSVTLRNTADHDYSFHEGLWEGSKRVGELSQTL